MEILLLVVGLMLAAVVLVGVGDRLRLPWPALMPSMSCRSAPQRSKALIYRWSGGARRRRGLRARPARRVRPRTRPDPPAVPATAAVRDGAAHVVGRVPGSLAHDRLPRRGVGRRHGRGRRRNRRRARPGADRHRRDRPRRDGRPARPGCGGGRRRTGADAAAAARRAAERGAVQRRHRARDLPDRGARHRLGFGVERARPVAAVRPRHRRCRRGWGWSSPGPPAG